MGAKGRPTKYQLTYAQKVWDNYNQYHPVKEANDKELKEHQEDVRLQRLIKGYTKLAVLAGLEPTKAAITIISKKALHRV